MAKTTITIGAAEFAAEMGRAWDNGWDSGHAQGEWGHSRKPRNPYTGEMNDEADDYCPEHGGTCVPEDCGDDSHWPPERIEQMNRGELFKAGRDAYGIVLPEVKVLRGGIRYPKPGEN